MAVAFHTQGNIFKNGIMARQQFPGLFCKWLVKGMLYSYSVYFFKQKQR